MDENTIKLLQRMADGDVRLTVGAIGAALTEIKRLKSIEDSERRARNALETIRATRVRETKAIQAMNDALREALPLLVRLGDFDGNGEGPGLGQRCEVILKAKAALAQLEASLLSFPLPKGTAGDHCGPGNACGRLGCEECQQ